MKKWIYLILGLILFIIPIVNGLNFQFSTDSYTMGENFGKLLIPIVGLVLIYKFFRISRKKRKVEEIIKENKMKKNFYKVYLYLLIIVSVPNVILGILASYQKSASLDKVVEILTMPELILILISVWVFVRILKLKCKKKYLIIPTVYFLFFLLATITGIALAYLNINYEEFIETYKLGLNIFQGVVYLFIIGYSAYLLKSHLPILSESKSENLPVEGKKALKGIGGWLGFFVFTLVLSFFYNIIVGFKDVYGIVTNQNVFLDQKDLFIILDILFFLFVLFFIAYAIYSLLKQKSNAIAVSKMTLGILFIGNAIVFGISVFSGADTLTENNYLALFFKTIFYSIVWFLYLMVSKRVESTFPKTERKSYIFDKIIFAVALIATISLYSFTTYTTIQAAHNQEYDEVVVDWQDFSSISNNFTIQFPTEPYHDMDVLEHPDFAGFLEYDIYYSYGVDDTEYFVYVTDFPKDLTYQDDKLNLQAALNAITNIPVFELVESKYGIFNGQDSLYYLIKETEAGYFMKGQIVKHGTVVYNLNVTYDEGFYNDLDYNNFIDSFRPNIDPQPILNEAPDIIS